MKPLPLACLLPLLLLALPARAESVVAESSVDRVVVFPDRARVTRTATVQLPGGEHEILVRGLPPNIDQESLRATGAGTARAVMGALDVRRGFRPQARQEQVRNLKAQIQLLEDADKELADAQAAAEFQLAYLRALSAKSADDVGKRTLSTKELASEVTTMLDTMDARVRRAQTELRKVAVERRGLADQLAALRGELQQLERGNSNQELVVSVAIAVQRKGELTLELTYNASGAGWSPTYDARVDPASGALEMTYGAWVTQRTGEDWDDAALVLSTARPALGVSPPGLPPWYLQSAPPPRPQAKRRSPSGARSAGAYAEADAAMDMDEELAYEAPAPVEYQTAEVNTEGPAVEFGVPGRVSIPGDGTRKRVTVSTWAASKVDLRYVAVPSLSTSVYLSAEVTHQQPFPLLPGEVHVFLVDGYVGRGGVPAVASGETYELAFGVDERVKLERKLVKQDEGRKGVFSGKDAVTRHTRATLENFHDKPITVLLRDRLPVSQVDRITVTLLPETQPAPVDKEQGLLEWTVRLAPKAKAEVDLHYRVEFPPDERPWNL